MLRKLEKYEIIEEIGHGGMATVYRARDTRLDRPVAVKVMHPHLRTAREARVRFVREAQSVARLRHPNILDIYDNSGEDSDEAYIVTELLTGPTLKVFAEAHDDIPAEIAACFTVEIARALASAHEAGIVHRDVKPENVMLHEDRCIKLTDFGIAQMVDSQSFTATGQILGSPGHMAPEQVEGKECDARTDLFSLGTVLYYLATGRLPFQARNAHAVLKRIVDGDYADPVRVKPTVGGRLGAIIDRALSLDPDTRYQTAEELEGDLLEFVAEAGIEDPSETLAAYLQDPEAVSSELRASLVPRLTERGRQAAKEGRVPVALDYYNRALALDDGNERVLELIDQIGRRSRRRGWFLGTGLALAALGLGALGFALVGVPGEAEERGSVGPVGQAGIGGDAGRDEVVEDPSEAARATSSSTADGGQGNGAELAGSSEGGGADPAPDPDGDDPPPRRAVRRAPSGPRLVRFAPQPQSVSISVDGADPREFGPSFNAMELSPGRHQFRFVALDGAHGDLEFSATIPPGAEPYVLSRRLPLEPARLLILADVAGQVEVEGRASGSTNRMLRVPVETADRDVLSFTVTAPGHEAYTGRVRLRAGDLESIEVDLTEVAAEGAP